MFSHSFTETAVGAASGFEKPNAVLNAERFSDNL
jgi:hypothetical protein